jgi:hypothetical protein
MTMTAERSGSCSTAVAALDVEEEVLEDLAVAAALPEAECEEEVDAGNCMSEKQFKKVAQKDDRDR